MANNSLGAAKKAKNDEFYTQYGDIEKEMNSYLEFDKDLFKDKVVLLPCDDPEWSNFTKYFAQNFKKLGLKKLISTSYAPDSKLSAVNYEPSKIEQNSSHFDSLKSKKNGKLFVLMKDITGDGNTDFNDFEWEYLKGNGDFKSAEVTKLRDIADIIVTNPPFSLFREFIEWANHKKFLIIGNINGITYKEVFPLIQRNKIWFGVNNGAKTYMKPDKSLQTFGNTCWFTNLDHGRRHEPLELMTMEDNKKFNKKIKDVGYQKYDNYDAIEVPQVLAIPSDYNGIMGVPISFLYKYNPEQFEILGSQRWAKTIEVVEAYCGKKTALTDYATTIKNKETYDRIFIRHKKNYKG